MVDLLQEKVVQPLLGLHRWFLSSPVLLIVGVVAVIYDWPDLIAAFSRGDVLTGILLYLVFHIVVLEQNRDFFVVWNRFRRFRRRQLLTRASKKVRFCAVFGRWQIRHCARSATGVHKPAQE